MEKIIELANLQEKINELQLLSVELKLLLEKTVQWVNLDNVRQEVNATNAEFERLREEIKQDAIAIYLETGNKHPLDTDAVSIRINKRAVYNMDTAFAWALAYWPKSLKLDAKLFEKHAKAVADTQPLDFVILEDEPQAIIATDLSEYRGW